MVHTRKAHKGCVNVEGDRRLHPTIVSHPCGFDGLVVDLNVKTGEAGFLKVVTNDEFRVQRLVRARSREDGAVECILHAGALCFEVNDINGDPTNHQHH